MKLFHVVIFLNWPQRNKMQPLWVMWNEEALGCTNRHLGSLEAREGRELKLPEQWQHRWAASHSPEQLPRRLATF